MRCLCSTQTTGDWTRAKEIVQSLSEDAVVGNRLAVQVMQLDMLLADAPVRRERVQAALGKMMRSLVLTDQTFKM